MERNESTENVTKHQFVTLNQTDLTQVTGGMYKQEMVMVGARTLPEANVSDFSINKSIDVA